VRMHTSSTSDTTRSTSNNEQPPAAAPAAPAATDDATATPQPLEYYLRDEADDFHSDDEEFAYDRHSGVAPLLYYAQRGGVSELRAMTASVLERSPNAAESLDLALAFLLELELFDAAYQVLAELEVHRVPPSKVTLAVVLSHLWAPPQVEDATIEIEEAYQGKRKRDSALETMAADEPTDDHQDDGGDDEQDDADMTKEEREEWLASTNAVEQRLESWVSSGFLEFDHEFAELLIKSLMDQEGAFASAWHVVDVLLPKYSVPLDQRLLWPIISSCTGSRRRLERHVQLIESCLTRANQTMSDETRALIGETEDITWQVSQSLARK